MIVNNKQIWLGLFIGIVMSFSVYSQNINTEKIAVPDSKLTNLYQIDLGVYHSEQPSGTDFKALEKYGIREMLNLHNRHSNDDGAAGTKIKLYRLKMKTHSVSEGQLINALRITEDRKRSIVFHRHHGSDRTSAVCAMYRIVFQGVSKRKVIQEMTEEGFSLHRIYKNIIRTTEKADIECIKREVL